MSLTVKNAAVSVEQCTNRLPNLQSFVASLGDGILLGDTFDTVGVDDNIVLQLDVDVRVALTNFKCKPIKLVGVFDFYKTIFRNLRLRVRILVLDCDLEFCLLTKVFHRQILLANQIGVVAGDFSLGEREGFGSLVVVCHNKLAAVSNKRFALEVFEFGRCGGDFECNGSLGVDLHLK